uniref:Uncharacterized protein n=1 Tax=Lepeophtheirus salmonis TaxID=72036 RepID=A0A0K2V6I2_LEPSM
MSPSPSSSSSPFSMTNISSSSSSSSARGEGAREDPVESSRMVEGRAGELPATLEDGERHTPRLPSPP